MLRSSFVCAYQVKLFPLTYCQVGYCAAFDVLYCYVGQSLLFNAKSLLCSHTKVSARLAAACIIILVPHKVISFLRYVVTPT